MIEQLRLEIDPLLSEPYLVYVFGHLNARNQARRFSTPEALLSCLTGQLGVETKKAEHAVSDLCRRGQAQIGRGDRR
jgi:hypothetical protein